MPGERRKLEQDPAEGAPEVVDHELNRAEPLQRPPREHDQRPPREHEQTPNQPREDD